MPKLLKTMLVASLLVIGAAAHPAFATPLTEASLKAMIQNMGYTVTETTSDNAKNEWISVTLPDNSYTIQMYFQLSSDKTELWLIANLSKIPPGKPVPASALMGMLVENDTIAPKCFSIGKTNSTIYLNGRTRNDNVTPAVLRQNLDTFTGILTRTEAFWAPDKWPAGTH
jgi:hypothetical protein